MNSFRLASILLLAAGTAMAQTPAPAQADAGDMAATVSVGAEPLGMMTVPDTTPEAKGFPEQRDVIAAPMVALLPTPT